MASCAGVSCNGWGVMRGWRSIFDSLFSPSKRNFSSDACWSMMKSWRPSASACCSPPVRRAAMMKPRLNWPMTRICVKQLLSNLNAAVSAASLPVLNFATSSIEALAPSPAFSEDKEKELGNCTAAALCLAASSCTALAAADAWASLALAAAARRRATAASRSAILTPTCTELPHLVGIAAAAAPTAAAAQASASAVSPPSRMATSAESSEAKTSLLGALGAEPTSTTGRPLPNMSKSSTAAVKLRPADAESP
mmetsp:Transcript_93068/g.266906  ORF Transcript_93068/g.266906 Transcript_93068/m.266906 type:complete len:253 (-) Transcript_93068:1492-2250(-)